MTLYGFTEVLPGRITTDRIVSGDGSSYFDLLNAALKLKDKLQFNTNGDGELRFKGVLVQSQNGVDEAPLGCYRGEYNAQTTYFNGDEVTYRTAEDKPTSTYRCISETPITGVPPTNSLKWSVSAAGVAGEPGKDGISPNASFKSTVFIRTNQTPARPTGGSFSNPVPTGWSDGIPAGEAKLWASTRIFTTDGKAPQQSAWTQPRQMTDTADFDVEFSSEENPSAPTGHPNTNSQWSNESSENTIWMATSRKSNGVWGAWQVSRIKGESGEDGSSIHIKGNFARHFVTLAEWNESGIGATRVGGTFLIDTDLEAGAETSEETKYCIIKQWGSPRPGYVPGWMTKYAEPGDAYIMVNSDSAEDGDLFVADTERWVNVGRIKGDPGNPGAAGKNAYVHIKFANSLTANDWTANNGETPGEYIGIYADNNPTDSTKWSDYKWMKWTGQDGLGYEFIYKRTTSASAPATPTTNSQADGYVPSGWTDDPTGVNSSYPYEWVCYRKKTEGEWGSFIGSSTNNSVAALWAKYGQNGATGAAGNYTEYRFATNGSTTTPPALTTNALNPTGWTTAMPFVNKGYYLWMTKAVKNGAGTILVSAWSTPVRMTPADGKDGAAGKSPVMVYRGVYSSSKTYYGNANRLDCVKQGDTYYIARIDAGTFSNVAPPDTSKWNNFGASFESVATELLLAENANLAGWIFRNGRLESEAKASSGEPMAWMDGKTGTSRMNGIVQFSCGYSGNISDSNLFYLPKKSSEQRLTLGHEKEDIGKVVRLFNSNPIGGANYMIYCCTFGIGDLNGGGTLTNATIGTNFYAKIKPQEFVEFTCFQQPPKTIGSSYFHTIGQWAMTGRFGLEHNRNNDCEKGRYPVMLAMGRLKGAGVSTNNARVTVEGRYYDGSYLSSKMTCTRVGQGHLRVTFASGLFPSGYYVFCTGYGANMKGSILNDSATGFDVYVADDSTLNDADISIMVLDGNWWFDYSTL